MKNQDAQKIANLKNWFSKKKGASALERILILHSQKLLYVETPKAGCTKIRSLLILLNQNHENRDLANFLQTRPASYYHWEFGIPDNQSYSNQELSLLFNNSNYYKFAFVRNPYERLASAYADRICQPHLKNYEYYIDIAKTIKAESIWNPNNLILSLVNQLDNLINGAIPQPKSSASLARLNYFAKNVNSPSALTEYNYTSIERRMHESYGKYFKSPYQQVYEKFKMLFGYPSLESINLSQTPVSFEEFVEFVCKQNVEDMNEHWQIQTHYIGYDFIDYNFIGRLENFDRDIQTVFSKINAPEYLYRYISGKMNESKKQKIKIEWTDELAKRVYEKYRSDFEVFCYDRMSYKR